MCTKSSVFALVPLAPVTLEVHLAVQPGKVQHLWSMNGRSCCIYMTPQTQLCSSTYRLGRQVTPEPSSSSKPLRAEVWGCDSAHKHWKDRQEGHSCPSRGGDPRGSSCFIGRFYLLLPLAELALNDSSGSVGAATVICIRIFLHWLTLFLPCPCP